MWPAGGPRARATRRVTDTRGEVIQRVPATPADGGWWQVELGPRSEGTYRVKVGGEGTVDPVSDVFAVVSALD
jgi:hypothetical protein